MKKIIAVLLSILMIFTSLSVVGYAADSDDDGSQDKSTIDKLVDKIGFENALDGFGDFNIDISGDGVDVEALLTSGALDSIDMLGLSVDFLYNSTTPLRWSNLKINKDDLTLAKANINMYLLGILKKQIGGIGDVKLFTSKNATAIANVIGHLVNPDYTDKVLKGNNYSEEDSFFKGVANESGLTDVIQHNWCDQPRINFKPLLYILGFDFEDDNMLGASKLDNGERVAATLIKSVIYTVLRMGPVEYGLTVLSNLAKTYNMFLLDSIKALFKGHINRGNITEDEISTLKGLLNLLFNGNNPDDTEHLQFITPPGRRFAMATSIKSSASSSSTDTTEMFLYMMLYLNLTGKYKSNPSVVANIKGDVDNCALEEEEKENLCALLDGFFLGDLSDFTRMLQSLVYSNLSGVKDSIGAAIKKFFISIFKGYADIIKKIINSFLHFGDF